MPAAGDRDSVKRRERTRRGFDNGESRGSPKWGLLTLPVASCAFILVLTLGVLQLGLLSRHVDLPAWDGQAHLSADAVQWGYIGAHESNITLLSLQLRELAGITATLGEDMRRQRETIANLERHQLAWAKMTMAGKPGAEEAALADSISKAAESRPAADSNTRSHFAGDPNTRWPPPVPSSLDSVQFPEEWLQRFSRAELVASAKEAEHWRDATKAAFRHAWNGYRSRAWGKDELRPVSGGEGRLWGKCGMQILDALSTIWVMGLQEEFDEATKWVEESLTFEQSGLVSFFEMTIRGLGGLVSAHALSGREVFLRRAKELADRMLPAFNPAEPGYPQTQVNLKTGAGTKGWFGGTLLAEAGTVQLEFRYVSQATGDPKYAEKADRAMRSILIAAKGKGLVPWGLAKTGTPHFINSHVTFGAMGDSYYEYLLKMWIQTSKTEANWLTAWKQAMKEMKQRLIFVTRGGLTYVAEENGGKIVHKMDHLACFVGGMLIYGSRQLPPGQVMPTWETDAAAITETCYQMYNRQPSHLAPEVVSMTPTAGEGKDMKVHNNAAHYLLRPEAAEAIYYMFYYTGDPKYRRMAGEIFEAIESHAKATFGYSAVRDVRQAKPTLRNEMETFFLAETLKYLYLTFLPNPRAVVDLDEFVFNTEAHPVRIFRPGQSQAGGGFMAKAT